MKAHIASRREVEDTEHMAVMEGLLALDTGLIEVVLEDVLAFEGDLDICASLGD